MSFESFTALLGAKDFPFVSDFFQRAIVIPSLDQPQRLPRPLGGDAENSNDELAQHYYCQNVMPTAEGLMSVGYGQIVSGLPLSLDFDQVITLRDSNENNFLFAPANGKNYIYTANKGVWQSYSPFTGWTGTLVSRSYVNGRTFICYQRHSIHEYDVTTDTFNTIAFTYPVGIDVTKIDCIGASNNYLLWASNITIGWSSLISPTDLVPSIQTGAGFAIPQDVKGPIRAIIATAGGFLIYTTKNVVAAMFTNNARAPFIFREVSGAGGLQNSEQISVEASLKEQYAWTTAGLQKISINVAESVNTAATDFLGGKIFENFDFSTLILTTDRLVKNLKVKLAFISNRYLVISYGKDDGSSPSLYTHALVYDTNLKRWGKLRIDHTDCFFYPYPNLIGSVTETPPKDAVAFLQKDGTIQLLIMDYRIRQDQGVMVLGRFQLVRQKEITFQSLELENTTQAYPPDVYLMLSYDGKTNQAPAKLQLLQDNGIIKKYGAPQVTDPNASAPARTAKNISFLFVGKFETTTALLNFTRHGNR